MTPPPGAASSGRSAARASERGGGDEETVQLALVLGGGVSLGAYVAGATSEILLALERSEARRVRVRVLAGTSAGALNAALAARALAVNPSVRPWLERAWLDGVDLESLLNPHREDRSALLDTSDVERLAAALITAEPAADDRRSPAAGDPLRVGIALSNLHGIEYAFRGGFRNAPDRPYAARVHRDWIELELGRERGPSDSVWTRLREAALASAAVPLAFPARPLDRRRSEYPGARLPGDGDTVRMWYVDGGLFENEPLGLAKRLAERFPDHRDRSWRYVLVDPYMESGTDGEARPRAAPRGAGDTAALVLRALLGQAAARDWRRAQKVNARLEILQDLACRLPEVGDRLRQPEAVTIGRAIGEMAERVAEMKVAVGREPHEGPGDPVVEYLDENLARIQADPRFRPAFRDIEARAGRTRVAKLIFLLEAAGGLRDKEVMPLFLVAPPSGSRLAGDFLGNFGGFFHRGWREHDIRAGRRDAHRLLAEHFADVLPYEPDPPSAYEAGDLDPDFGDVPREGRELLERYAEHEAERVLRELEPGFLGSLTRFAWEPVLRRWAARRALRALERAG